MASVEQASCESRPSRAPSLEELYEVHAPGLRRRCQRLTRDPHATEDLMQEVFVRFMTRFPEVPADMNVAGYLYATARNVLWKQLRDGHEISAGEIESWAGPDDDLEVDPERSTLLGEQQRIVRRCSAVLTGRQRRALTLREIEGRSYAEIGSDLGIGTGAVAQVISRARVRLRVAVRRAHVDLDQLSPECRAMLGPLSDYLDGHAASSSAEIEAHLKDCASCRHSLASFQTAGSRLRGTLPLVPFAGILARIGEAVRLGGGGPVDAVRAGALVLAAAAAIGGGGMYVAHDLPGSSASHPAQAPLQIGAAAATPISFPPHLAITATTATSLPVTPGERGQHGARRASQTHPSTGRTPVTRRTETPTVSTPATTGPSADPVSTPVRRPVTTPSVDQPTRPVTPPTSGGVKTPGVTPPVAPSRLAPPVSKTVKGLTPVTKTVASVTDPVVAKAVAPLAEKVVRPVVDTAVSKVVAPVLAPVTTAVAPVTVPVSKAVGAVTAPVTKAVAPVTDPVAKAVAPITDPVAKAVAPVMDPIVKVAAPLLPPSTPTPAASQAGSVPATTATTPATGAPATTTPGITLPSIKVGLG